MADILLRDIPPEMKRQIEDLAHEHRRSLSNEAKHLLERALAQTLEPAGEGDRGLGTRLGKLIAPEDWSDDFLQPRDQFERPTPDFE